MNNITEIDKKQKYESMPIQALKDILVDDMSKLAAVCLSYDNGEDDAARELSCMMKSLLVRDEQKDSASLMDSLRLKDGSSAVEYVSTAFPRPSTDSFTMGWNFGSNISNITLSSDKVYAGLIIKTLSCDPNGNYVIEYRHKADRHSYANKVLPLKDWLNEVIFWEPENKRTLTRKEVIVISAYTEETLPASYAGLYPKYKLFELANLFNIVCSNNVVYQRNPMIASIRQMAWEVQESINNSGILQKGETIANQEIDPMNDFRGRMESQAQKGISVPLSGKGIDFLRGILDYALSTAQKYVYFYLPLIYQEVISQLQTELSKSKLDVKGVFFKSILEQKEGSDIEKMDNMRTAEISKFPFVIYDDEYYALEDSDADGNKVWVGNMKSSNNVKYLRAFFDKLYNDRK